MANQITVQQAREYFELGALVSATIVQSAMSDKWMVLFDGKNDRMFSLVTTRGEPREFATLDAAHAVLVSIGWPAGAYRCASGRG